uniref:MlaD family protein n=2 Tax=Burkholderia cepacia complex TaxID=87882 RepID=UPI003D767669
CLATMFNGALAFGAFFLPGFMWRFSLVPCSGGWSWKPDSLGFHWRTAAFNLQLRLGHCRSLVNLEQTTGAVADQRAEIATLISNLTEASRESTAAVRQANSTLRDANLLLNNDGKQIMVNTRDATASLERAAFRVETLLQNNQESLNQGLAATGPAMHELQQALANLNTVLRRLDRNPAQYLLGGENIEETKP